MLILNKIPETLPAVYIVSCCIVAEAGAKFFWMLFIMSNLVNIVFTFEHYKGSIVKYILPR